MPLKVRDILVFYKYLGELSNGKLLNFHQEIAEQSNFRMVFATFAKLWRLDWSGFHQKVLMSKMEYWDEHSRVNGKRLDLQRVSFGY